MAELHLGGGYVLITDPLSRGDVRRLRRKLGRKVANPKLFDHEGAAVVSVARGRGRRRKYLQFANSVRPWPCEALLAHGGTFTPNN